MPRPASFTASSEEEWPCLPHDKRAD
jgi:hypothetical protein